MNKKVKGTLFSGLIHVQHCANYPLCVGVGACVCVRVRGCVHVHVCVNIPGVIMCAKSVLTSEKTLHNNIESAPPTGI